TFKDRWTPIDPRWNLHELYIGYGRKLHPYLMHFTSTKPWSVNRSRSLREAASWYRNALAGSAWPAFVEPQSFKQMAKADLKAAARRYYPHIYERLSHVLPQSLVRRMPHGRYLPWVPRSAEDVEDMAEALVQEARGERLPLRPPEAILR